MTKKPHPQKPSKPFIQSHYMLTATILVLLGKAHLSPTVKAHCRTGFVVIEIIYLDRVYHSGKASLYKPEFDAFFKCFPKYVDAREALTVDVVIAHVRGCIRSGEVVVGG